MNAQWLTSLGERFPFLSDLSGLPLYVLLAIAVLTIGFVAGYALKGGQVGWQLWTAVRRIRVLASSGRPVGPQEVAGILVHEPCRHLWDEYADTLHELQRTDAGAPPVTEVRATMPAEAFFTRDVLVDSRLFDDFTRHLPGVLTGLGIIGTFAGLLKGLTRFDAGSTATAVAGLKPLLDGVANAFSVSAIAIGCAMFVVLTSKFCLAVFYRLVEQLNQGIDALYATGAGEEYLSRLVRSSENSEAHAAELKQTLVAELGRLTTQLVDRQIEAHVQSNRALATQIGETLAGTLAIPLQQMTGAIAATGQDNSQAVGAMIESVLSRFMSRMEQTFSEQAAGIRQQADCSTGLMTSVGQSLQQLLEGIDRSNEQTSSRLSGALAGAIEAQDHSRNAMEQAIAKVLQQLSTTIEHLDATRSTAAAQQDLRNDQLLGRTQDLVGGLSGQVEVLLKAMAAQVAQTQRNVDAIGSVTTRAIDGMNAGAQNMGSAAKRFEVAGGIVAGVFDRSAQVADQLTAAAESLQSAATAVRQGFEQYEGTRQTVDANVAALTGLITTLRTETGLSKELLAELERIVAQLKVAGAHSQQYLENVNKTLVGAFQDFGNSLTHQLRTTMGDTDRHLSSGVQQLNGVVQHIGLALSRFQRV